MTAKVIELELTPEALDFSQRTADIPDTFGDADSGAEGGATGETQPQASAGGLTAEAIKASLQQLSNMASKMVKDGGFWQLQDAEAQSLAEVWHPILAPLWARWLSETNGLLLPALMVTMISLVPRVVQEASRRASMKVSTATAKSGDLQPFSDLPEAGSQPKQTD